MSGKKIGFFNRVTLALFILTLAGFLALVLQPVFAEQSSGTATGSQGGQMQGKGKFKGMGEGKGKFEGLNLTDEQKAKMKAVWESKKPQLKAIRENTSLTPEQKKEKLKTLRDSIKNEMKAILTPEQQKTLEEKKSKMGEMRKKVGLTDEQKQKMKALRDKFKPEIQAIKNDSTLSKEQKMAKMKDVLAKMETELKTFLTPEQQKKFEEKKGKWGMGKMKNCNGGSSPGPATAK
jgi:periplasmic protein CpxP/Spy